MVSEHEGRKPTLIPFFQCRFIAPGYYLSQVQPQADLLATVGSVLCANDVHTGLTHPSVTPLGDQPAVSRGSRVPSHPVKKCASSKNP